MALSARIAVNLANHGDERGTRTDVLQTVDVVTTILAISLLTPLMVCKISIKRFIGGGCCKEDSICIFAWIVTTAYCVTGLLMAAHGGGNHQRELPPSELIDFRKVLYADSILYGPAAFLTKTSLLLSFARVFAHARKVVLFVYAFLAVTACYYLPILLLKTRLCTPLAGLWDPSVNSRCFNQQGIFFTDAIVSAVTDVVILFLPGPLVCTLKVSVYKKLRIGALLSAGGLATVASVSRAILIWSPDLYEDITVSFVRISLLGIAEVSIGIICACIPTLNILFTRYTKGHWGGPNSKYAATGKPSPSLKMRRLTADAKGIHFWRKGHEYNNSFESEADETIAEVGTAYGGGGGSDGVNPEREDRPTKWKSESQPQREVDVESEAGSGMIIQETATEIRKAERGQRHRSREEDTGWPL